MGVACVVLTGHGREGVTSAQRMSALTREPRIGVVVVRAVDAGVGHPLLLELHQTLDLVRLRV